VSSLSKTYGIPGIRVGWLVCRDATLMQLFLAAKEQIGISGSVIDEHVALQALLQREEWLRWNNGRIRKAFAFVKRWVGEENLVEWVEPQGGCVCFPRIRLDIEVDLPLYYQRLYGTYSTYVGRGRWFEMPDRHFRIGYGWPSEEQLQAGLANISSAIRDAQR
jgi:aspartate/methionine/tyrosine aminotransferase